MMFLDNVGKQCMPSCKRNYYKKPLARGFNEYGKELHRIVRHDFVATCNILQNCNCCKILEYFAKFLEQHE